MTDASTRNRQRAGVLIAKAREDLEAARCLDAAGQSDSVVGFHVQQSLEKSIKATLVFHGRDAPRTHDLEMLARLAGDVGTPERFSLLSKFNRWAVQGRYTQMHHQLDRQLAIDLAGEALAWA